MQTSATPVFRMESFPELLSAQTAGDFIEKMALALRDTKKI
jgi:hypothetical protein